MITNRLGVCSWSLQPLDPLDLAARLERVGVRRVQLALGPLLEEPTVWSDAAAILAENGVDVRSGMIDMIGEDYQTLATIRETGGVRPDATWPGNRRRVESAADIAGEQGLGLVTFHGGFLPESDKAAHAVMVDRLGAVADIFAKAGVRIALETGPERAETVVGLLESLGGHDVGVNFDPANMILYGSLDPVAAIRRLAPWVRQVHVKDALATEVPGTWGREVPVGTGVVDWPVFLDVVAGLTPPVDFFIEREAGGEREADVIAARRFLERTVQPSPSN